MICMRLQNKIAVITGAGSGIGRAIAYRFAQEGADIVIPDINFLAAQETAQHIETLGRKALAIEMDVTNQHNVLEMVETVVNQF